MIKQQLTQKLQQRLSPLQIQQIKMLELNSLEMDTRIDQELEENPALEIGEEKGLDGENSENLSEEEMGYDNNMQDNEGGDNEDMSLGDYLTEDDIPDYKLQQHNNSEEERREDIPFSESESLQEYLTAQFTLRNLSPEYLQIGEYIIGSLDEDGYLRRDVQSIANDLAFHYSMDFPIEEIERVWEIIKDLDPPGIAAASLQECLLIQLKKKKSSDCRNSACNIIENYFEDFSKKHYDKIIKSLNIPESELKEAIREILSLDPKPGGAWSGGSELKLSHVVPDFIVETVNGELFLSLSQQNIPELRVSKEYLHMMEDYAKNKSNRTSERKKALVFVKQKIDSAKWFIDAVKQRQQTLEATMLAIMQLQKKFFLSGDEKDLKPMILKDVADICGYDISTVSRVSNSKYVQTNFGIYPLKYFFSEALHQDSGNEVSSREVKSFLRSCIEEENKKKPYTDDVLVRKLKENGYEVARRTVAKYREQLGIPVARLRKEV